MRKIILIILCFVTLRAAHAQAPGTLNKNFGSGGIVKDAPGNAGVNGTFYAVQTENCFALGNGKLILLLNLQGSAILTQHLPGGGVDSTYGKNGFSVSLAISNPVAAVQPDGKIIIAGTTAGPNQNFIVARLNTNGSLDSQFGNSGVTITDAGSESDMLSAVVVAPSGQIIAGGQTVQNNTNDFALIRYTSAGKIDGSFGQNGIVVTSLGSSSNVTSLALQSDNKILAAGNFNNGTSYFAVARYKTTGVLDTSFNRNGVVTASPGTSAAATSVAISSGRIIEGGYSYNQSGIAQFNILQLTASGAIDSTFGTFGWAYGNFGTPYQALTSMQIAANGRILTGGYAEPSGGNAQFALAKFLPNGIPDSSFGKYGQVLTALTDTTQDYATCLSLQSNGEILLGGYSAPPTTATNFGLVRYESNGALDNSFAMNGLLISTYPNQTIYYSDILLQPDGKLVVFGGADLAYNFSPDSLWRYGAQGALDHSYGQNGRAPVNFLGFYTGMQSDGKLVMAGGSDSIQVVRYLENGSMDQTYGNGGMVSLDFLTGDQEWPASIAVQPDGKSVVGAWSENFFGVSQGIVTRLLANGTLDPSFGTNGATIFSVGNFGIVTYISIAPSGKIVIAGEGSNPTTYQFYSYVARLKSNGVIDSSFGQNGFLTFTQGLGSQSSNVFALATGKILYGYEMTTNNINYTAYVTRLNANGSTDSSYGTKGTITVANGELALEPDQKLLLLSSALDAQDNTEFVLSRYLTTGSPDLTFGTKGTVETNLNPGEEFIGSAVCTGNELAVAGTVDDPYGIGLAAEFNLGPQSAATTTADLTVPTDPGTCSAKISNIESLITGTTTAASRFKITRGNNPETQINQGSLNQFAFNKGLTSISYWLGDDTTKAGDFTVNVVDEEAPVITQIGKSIDPKVGPDNQVDLRLSYEATDNCGNATATIEIDEENTGNPSKNWQIIDDHHAELKIIENENNKETTAKIYTIKIKATDAAGNTAIKEDTVEISGDLFANNKNLEITTTPNPSTSRFSVHISSNKQRPVNLQLYNTIGASIQTFNQRMPGETIQFGDNLTPGVYFLKATQDEQIKIVRIVKM
jgi:uncharacterized delta-60 repeat protein